MPTAKAAMPKKKDAKDKKPRAEAAGTIAGSKPHVEPVELEVKDSETCPICHEKTLILTEAERDIPYFGQVYLFSMTCNSCKFHKADVEAAEQKPPLKVSLEVSSPDDMKIRVVKSSQATVKIPHLASIDPGPASNGYVSNVEGILVRIKQQVESLAESEEEDESRQKAKKLVKKINRIIWGEEKVKLIIDDPSGNSAIISEKAVIEGNHTHK